MVFVLRKTKVGEGQLAALVVPAGDGTTAIHLPVNQRVGNDIGHPHLHRGKQQRRSIGIFGGHEENDQVHHRVLIHCHESERLAE